MKFITLLLLSSFFSVSHAVDLVTWNKKIQTFKNVDCEKTDSCDLKLFRLQKNDYRVRIFGNSHFGSKMFAWYETDKTENLHKYSIVQFIKGCHFGSKKVAGKVEISWPYEVKSFNEYIKFKYSDWAVDSLDMDPMYSSWDGDSDMPRHSYYRWNKKRFSTDKKSEKYYGWDKPINPLLYIKDMPGQAFKDGDEAFNTSFEFKTCIYKEENIPRVGLRQSIDFGAPIHCFSWSQSFIYNHKLHKYEQKKEIDPVCLQ